MPRIAKLREKNGHWFSAAGDPAGRYYGRIGEVSHGDALARFHKFLAEVEAGGVEVASIPPIAVNDLIDRFLTWLGENRPGRTAATRGIHLKRWREDYGLFRATSINAKHLEAFLGKIPGLQYRKHHEVTVKAMVRWGRRHKVLPDSYHPFETSEPVRVPLEPLTEAVLPTEQEYRLLLQFADADLRPFYGADHRFRRREPGEYRDHHPFKEFRPLLICYRATGARTSELCDALVKDFQPRSRTIVLGKHKRSWTLRQPVPRTIALNDAAFAEVSRLVRGKEGEEPIFIRHNGRPWTQWAVNHRFLTIRERAGVRDCITPYSFRHLMATDMIEAGVDIARIARCLGTSVAMVERTYGHHRVAHLHDAQRLVDELRARRATPDS